MLKGWEHLAVGSEKDEEFKVAKPAPADVGRDDCVKAGCCLMLFVEFDGGWCVVKVLRRWQGWNGASKMDDCFVG